MFESTQQRGSWAPWLLLALVIAGGGAAAAWWAGQQPPAEASVVDVVDEGGPTDPIGIALHAHEPIRACFTSRERTPGDEGERVRFVLSIEPDGSLHGLQFVAKGHDALERCVLGATDGLRFPEGKERRTLGYRSTLASWDR